MDVMGIYYKGNIMGNTSHMRQEMKRSNTNLGFDIDVINRVNKYDTNGLYKGGAISPNCQWIGLRENLHETI
jgi:hypothetical protein